jgi:integrase
MVRRKSEIDYRTIPSIAQLRERLKDKVRATDNNFFATDKTIELYCYNAYLIHKEMGIPFDQKPTINDIERWRESAEDMFAPKTVSLKVTAINHYLQLVWGYNDYKVRRPKSPDRIREPQPIDDELIEAMIKFYKEQERYTWAYAILTQFETACRVDSLVNIQVNDIKPEDQEIYIRKMKYRFTHNCPVSPEYLEDIQEYIRKFRPNPKSMEHEKYLFIHEDTLEPLTYHSYNWALKRVATQLGIETNFHSHIIRHSAIKNFRKHGWKWEDIQGITNHKSLAGLSNYIHSEQKEKLKEMRRTRTTSTPQKHESPTESHEPIKGDEHMEKDSNALQGFYTIDADKISYTLTIDGTKVRDAN